MKQSGKYRFSLQFPAVTEQQIAVGEALEKMGNRKSTVIVNAVFQYMADYPDLFSAAALHKPRKREPNSISRKPDHKIENASQSIFPTPPGNDYSSDSVNSMLENLNLFEQT